MKHSHPRRFIRLSAALLAALLFGSCGSKPSPVHPEDLPAVPQSSLPSDSGQSQDSVTLEEPSDSVSVSSVRTYLPQPAEEASFPDDGKLYVEYAVNYGPAGKVKNGERRVLSTEGKKVEAVPNLGYKFVCWSDGSTDPVRTDTIAYLNHSARITAIFDYDVLDMPVIAIDTSTGKDVRSKTDYIDADFRICAAGAQNDLSETVLIRGRGNNTWGYEKKSYKVKFPEKVNLFGLGSGKDNVWVLLANVCDQSLQRNHVSFELARSFDGIAFSPASLSVEVYLNGEYRGVYLLAEEIRDSKARVNIDTDGYETETDIGYLVELSSYAKGDTFTVNGKSYQIHSDLSEKSSVKRDQIAFISDYLSRCAAALKKGDRAEIEELMDISSIVDTYLTEEVVKNLDTGWDSYYLYKEKGGKLCLGPLWDFDLSLGNANEGEELYYNLFTATRSGSGGGNPWYYTAMEHEWFRELVVARWDEVKADLLDTIPAAVREEGSSKLRSYERNFIRWPIFGTTQNRETEAIRKLKTYTAHYEYLASWAEQRIAWLDETYHRADFTTMRLSAGSDDSGFADKQTEKLFKSLTDLTEKVGVKKVTTTVDGFGGEGVENLFDGEPGTKYCWPCYGDTEINIELNEAVTPQYYALMTANDTKSHASRNPEKWTIWGSSDGKNWTVMAEVKNGRKLMKTANYVWSVFSFDSTDSCKYYKMKVTNDDIVQFGELALLGE